MGRRNVSKKTKKNAANKRKANGGGNNGASSLLKQMGEPLENLLRPDKELRGPADKDRKFPKWTKAQIERFLTLGEWDDSEEDDDEPREKTMVTKSEPSEQECETDDVSAAQQVQGTDVGDPVTNESAKDNDDDKDCQFNALDIEIERPVRAMPLPRPLESVYNASGGATSTASGQTGLLGTLLNPDAGGKGKNRDGIMGLIAAKQQRPPADARAALKARLRYMRKQRGAKAAVYDANGRKVKGAVEMTAEDMMYGNNKGRMRHAVVDKNKTAAHRRQQAETLRSEAATRKSGGGDGGGESPAQQEQK